MGILPAQKVYRVESDIITPASRDIRPGEKAGEDSLYDGWEVEHDLSHFGRRIGRWRIGRPSMVEGSAAGTSSTVAEPNVTGRRGRVPVSPSPAGGSDGSRGMPLEWNWGILAFGLMASLCGLTLTGWAVFSHEVDLWNVGFPILAGGASSVLVGVLLQLERIGHQSRS